MSISWLEHVSVNHSPLQLAGQDTIEKEYTIGGPDSNHDIRMVMHVKDLEDLIKVAKEAGTQRVVLRKCGLKIQLRLSRNGLHRYQVMKLISLAPKPERMIFV